VHAIEEAMRIKSHIHAVQVPLLSLAMLILPAGCGGATIKVEPGATTPISTSSSYSQQAGSAIVVLQRWYSPSSGVYASPTGWWNAANAITALGDYEQVTGNKAYEPVLANTFTEARAQHANFVNEYYDDDGWWALAWIEAYDVAGDARYLSMAETIFAAMTGAWDSTCGGGVWWNTSRSYKNAIPNELFLSIAAKLANRTTGTAQANYLSWAQKEWAWFKGSGMINAQSLVNDGLNSSNPNACTNNGRTTWTYNQGVILGGLVELSEADKDATLLPQAERIANAAMIALAKNGILTEPGTLSGGDGPQFKGIFMRNLAELNAAAPNPQYKIFADANATSIVANDQGPDGEFGGIWQGPFDRGDGTRQTSAIDALLAAAAMK
jgi:predicted alpha-1,6-mannanase (GH76 family)